MSDCVSREWLLKHLFFEVDRELVRKAPDAESVRNGMWIYHQAIPATCSVCGRSCGRYDDDYADRYCSNCGAKMDGGDTDE